jgi:hypothetical protein
MGALLAFSGVAVTSVVVRDMESVSLLSFIVLNFIEYSLVAQKFLSNQTEQRSLRCGGRQRFPFRRNNPL